MDCSMLGSTVLEFAQINVHWVGGCYLTILSSVILFSVCCQSFPASGSYQWIGSLYQAAKVLELQHQSFQWIFNNQWILISFRIDWFVLLAVQGTLKSSPGPQFKVILQCSAIFIIQISHSHMAMEKNIALNIWTFVGKVMSLLFNMLSRFSLLFFQGASVF